MPTITLNRQGLAIAGRAVFLLAGQVHYFRWPQAEWRALLLGAKAAGINTIDTVIPWNLHEPKPGSFDFQAEADLAAYLDLCGELGLYAIVRPGPYICAEWENGGFPAWLTMLPGIELRVDHPLFLEHTLRWFDRLFPLLAPRQFAQGGPIILCQIENEHWASGRYGHDDHQRTLARAAIERGIDLPQYTCMGGMDDWAEFRNGWSGIAEKLVQTRALWPTTPMIVSELWSGWFDNWGDSRHNHKTAARLDATLHQLTAVGASGFSHWMWAGGTNFGYWGGRTVGGDTILMTTSYDYDAPVDEYGQPTAKFYAARRHHLFLETLGRPLADVLAEALPGGPQVIGPAAVAGRGEAGSAPYRNVRAASSAPEHWQGFSATFLQNPGQEGQTHHVFLKQLAAHLLVEVEAGSIKPIFCRMPLGDGRQTTVQTQDIASRRRRTEDEHWGLTPDPRSPIPDSQPPIPDPRSLTPDPLVLDYHTGRILGFWPGPNSDLLVLYGHEGEVGVLQVGVQREALSIQREAFKVVGDVPSNVEMTANAQPSTLNAQLQMRYWITDRPTMVRAEVAGRALTLLLLTQARAERFWQVGAGWLCGPDLVLEDGADATITSHGIQPFYQLGPDGTLSVYAAPTDVRPRSSAPVVWGAGGRPLDWQQLAVAEASAAGEWQPIDRPESLEALGCELGYGWYRAEFSQAEAETTTLVAPWLSDRGRLLFDGVPLGWLGVDPAGPRYSLPLALASGQHELRLLADNLGRFNYGSNTGEQKGLLDTLYLGGQQHDLSRGWVALWQEAVFAGEALAAAHPAYVRADAADVDLANFGFQGPSVWLYRLIEARAGIDYLLHITGDRNPGALFVNGVNLARFSRHNGGGYIKRELGALLRPGSNVLALNIQGYAGLPWRATLLEYDRQRALAARWSFRAGVNPTDGQVVRGGPCCWRARFSYDPAVQGGGPLRLALPGLRKGQIWLNGHNLGRYWCVGPQEYYKLPVSWLQADNEVLIFDEEGASPAAVWIGGA